MLTIISDFNETIKIKSAKDRDAKFQKCKAKSQSLNEVLGSTP